MYIAKRFEYNIQNLAPEKLEHITFKRQKLLILSVSCRWAAIASYLPQRTDNDIKNYWNTHLKKRIKKYKTAVDSYMPSTDHSAPSCDFELAQPPYSADTSIPVISTLHPSLPRFFNTSSTYALSTENISRLLKGWMMPTADSNAATTTSTSIATTSTLVKPEEENITSSTALSPHEQLDSLLSFDNLDGSGWDNSSTGIAFHETIDEARPRSESSQAPLSLFDTWLLDEAAGQMEVLMKQWQQRQ